MQSEIEKRFNKSGSNVGGQKWVPILALSAARRRHPPAGAKKKAAADRKAGRTSRSKGASTIPLSQARPLLTERAAQSGFEAKANSVRVYPLRAIKSGGMAGLPVVFPHHPPSLTGHAGKGIMPDRSSFYIQIGKNDVAILKLGQRRVDKELKVFAGKTTRAANSLKGK